MANGMPRITDGPFVLEVKAQRHKDRGKPCLVRIELIGVVPILPDQTGAEEPKDADTLMGEMAATVAEYMIGENWAIHSAKWVREQKKGKRRPVFPRMDIMLKDEGR